jgi:hypothetical protein
MASFTLDQGPAPLTQDQVVIECLTNYITAVDLLVAELVESPGLRRANEIIRLTIEMGRAKGDAKLAGYLWPE